MSLNYYEKLQQHEGCGGFYHPKQEFMESPNKCKDYCLVSHCNYEEDGGRCVGAYKGWLQCSKCGEMVNDYKELRSL